jgi:hypothetical protein
MHSAYLLGLYEEGSFEEESGSRVLQHPAKDGFSLDNQEEDHGPEDSSSHNLHLSSSCLHSPTIGLRQKLRSLELSQVVFGEYMGFLYGCTCHSGLGVLGQGPVI